MFALRRFNIILLSKTFSSSFNKMELLNATIEETEKAVLVGKTKLSIIDTRTPAQMRFPQRIPTAKNLPGPSAIKEAFALDSADFKNKYGVDKPVEGDEIILHCNTGRGSGIEKDESESYFQY